MPPEVQHSQLPTQSHSPTSQTPSGIALSVTDLCVTLVSQPAIIPRVYKQILRRLRKRAQTTLNIGSSYQESNDIDGESNNKNSGKSILRNVNFRVDPGQVCLIIGGSGSGKTTLLNVITGNMTSRHTTISGDILFNGEDSKTYRKNGLIGYLQQEDYLLPFITVRETLRFAADLRLPTLSKQEKEDLIESLLLELGLKNCADTRVGDAHGCEVGQGGTRGISGGERRRVSAAIQLLTRPNLLVCDEVTSGLDAFTALELVKTLNTYARSSHSTVLLSIHQPRSEIFHLLSMTGGQLVLLSHGNVVYSGPMGGLLSWFVSVGLGQCPEHMNPLDFALDNCDSVPPNSTPGLSENAVVGGIGETDPDLQTNTSCSRMSPNYSHTMKDGCNSDAAQSLMPGQARLWQQVMVLCNRHWLKTQRNALLFWGFLAIHTFLAASVSIVFWRLDSELASIRARASVCYLLCAFQPYLSMILAIYRGISEMKVFDRERRDKFYGPTAFILSYTICSLPEITIYTIGFRTDSMTYLGWYILVNILFQFTISALAMFCISVERNFDRSTLIGSAFFLPFAMATGFIVPTSQIPHLLRWLKYISFHRLAYQILISLEFTDRHFDCPYKQSQTIDGAIVETADPARCSFWDGNTVLQGQLEGSIGFFPIPIAYIALHFLVYTTAAWAVLSMMPVNHLHSTSNQSPIEYVLRLVLCLFYNKESFSTKLNVEEKTFKARKDDGPVEVQSDTILRIDEEERRQCQSVAITVKDLSVFVAQTPNLQLKHAVQKPLLQNISFEIPAAQLTAILGGSGSGKTTLLNALLHRNSSSVSGDIYFNGVKALSKTKINAICGYVRQDDGFLMSHLTVRETLRYAAELGMEKSLPVAEKWRKAEEIMDLMGLRDCADVMVGGKGFSGCSGGQRRRVSIGMQLVIAPACLFLDEPTSGLDALTALSVIQALKRITKNGITVICAIHQPRIDIWNELDNVLLLMTEGRLAYTGKADEALGYFEQAGYAPPKHMNPPDFIIDTISHNTRSSELQESSNATIETFAILYKESREKGPNEDITITNPHQPPLPNRSSSDHRLFGDDSYQIGLFGTTKILTRRSFKNAIRKPGAYISRIAQPMVIVLLTVLFFWKLDPTPVGLLNRLGLFHQLMGATLAGVMVHTEVFPEESAIAFREISDGRYSTTSFLLSYMINELPLSLISASFSAGIIFLVTGLQTNATSVASMVLVMFAYITTGESLGIAYSACFRSKGGLGVAFMNSTVLWMSFMAGFLVPKLPLVLRYFKYASIFSYSAKIVSLNEFRGLSVIGGSSGSSDFMTKNMEMVASPSLSIPFQNGEAVLQFLNFEAQSLQVSIGMLAALMVIYRVMAWAALVVRARFSR